MYSMHAYKNIQTVNAAAIYTHYENKTDTVLTAQMLTVARKMNTQTVRWAGCIFNSLDEGLVIPKATMLSDIC